MPRTSLLPSFPLKLWVGMFDRNDGRQSFPDVVAFECIVQIFQQIIVGRVVVNDPCE